MSLVLPFFANHLSFITRPKDGFLLTMICEILEHKQEVSVVVPANQYIAWVSNVGGAKHCG